MADGALGEEPVTVVIRRRVRAGREAEYEQWLERLQVDARGLPGYMGATTQRPAADGLRVYVSVIRFATLAALEAFETGDLRRRHLTAVADIVEDDAVWERRTGLEFWFTPPPGAIVPQPSRPRMVLLMTIVVTSLVLTIGSAVGWVAERAPVPVPAPVRLLVTVAIEITFMTYWLMPRLTRRLASWIHPARAPRG